MPVRGWVGWWGVWGGCILPLAMCIPSQSLLLFSKVGISLGPLPTYPPPTGAVAQQCAPVPPLPFRFRAGQQPHAHRPALAEARRHGQRWCLQSQHWATAGRPLGRSVLCHWPWSAKEGDVLAQCSLCDEQPNPLANNRSKDWRSWCVLG